MYSDIVWLARICYVEGLDIGYGAKLAISNVVLNRVKDPRFPNTVYGVIFDDDYAIQFPPAHRSSFPTIEPSFESYIAAKNAFDGVNNISDCLYFNNSPFVSRANDLYIIIEGEYFYH
jgi:spore germination cell wall hydrolase CwlJ-like protein